MHACRYPDFYAFFKQVCLLYWRYRPGPLHDERKTLTMNAVSAAFCDWPATKLPYEGQHRSALPNPETRPKTHSQNLTPVP